MPNLTYQTTTVPPDLRREETIKQICDSLEYLEKISNDIFSRISTRVADNHNRLRKINDRVNLAQAKIEKIKGSNKATKVFSSAKYPAAASQEVYSSIHKDSAALQKVRSEKNTYHLALTIIIMMWMLETVILAKPPPLPLPFTYVYFTT